MMAARIVCPNCKSQGRLIRMVETEEGRFRCRHCGRERSREELIAIYENTARSFAETVAKLKGKPMQEIYLSPDGARYPNPDKPGTPSPRHFRVPTRILCAAALVAGVVGYCFTQYIAPVAGPFIKEMLR